MTRSPTEYHERILQIECFGDHMLGVLHSPATRRRLGILVVVGGPQYRVGSHRQFVLLARALADAGYPVLRFDYRGMGDSSGEPRRFDEVDADIRAALAALSAECPDLDGVVLWGLCDAASALMMYAPSDPRVRGLVLLNPWVRTAAGLARVQVRHYYLSRVFDAGFWRKLFAGELAVGRAVRELIVTVRRAGRSEPPAGTALVGRHEDFVDRMRAGFAAFRGPALFIISGNDLTAQEWLDETRRDRRWRRLLSQRRIERRDLATADHTFSSAEWRSQVERHTLAFIESVERG